MENSSDSSSQGFEIQYLQNSLFKHSTYLFKIQTAHTFQLKLLFWMEKYSL